MKITDRMQPAIDSALIDEKNLLASCMLKMNDFGEALQYVRNEDYFIDKRHAALWKALSDFEQSGDVIYPHRFPDWMEDHARWDRCGGREYVLELMEFVPHGELVRYYAECVEARYRQMRAFRAVEEMESNLAAAIKDPTIEIPAAIDRAEQALFGLNTDRPGTTVKSVSAVLKDFQENVRAEKDDCRLKTGLTDLDELLYDYEPGSLVVIGADTSIGKTSFALQLAEHLALNQTPCLYLSIEMNCDKLANRLILRHSGLTRSELKREPEAGSTVLKTFENAPLYMAYTPELTIYNTASITRRMIDKRGVKAVFIDYLQIMEFPDVHSEVNSVRILSKGLKTIAGQMNIPVVCISQLRKRGQGQAVTAPTLDDLHSSSALSKDADLILMLYRPEAHHAGDHEWAENNPELVNMAKIQVAKQRNGPKGAVKVEWDGKKMRFNSIKDTELEWFYSERKRS